MSARPSTYDQIAEMLRDNHPEIALEQHTCVTCQNADWLSTSYGSDSYRALVDKAGREIGICAIADGYAITSDDSQATVGCTEYESF